MKNWLLAVVLSGSFVAQGAQPAWFNQRFVERGTQQLAESLSDFQRALRGVPGTQDLAQDTQNYQTKVDQFSTAIGSTRPHALLKDFEILAEADDRFRHQVKGFHTRENSHYFVRDYFTVADAFSRLEYSMTASNGNPGPGGGGKPTLKPIELKESFSTSTGLYSPSASNVSSAGAKARSQCDLWRQQIQSTTSGTVVLAQCGSEQQFKGPDGKVWVRVDGEASLDFSKLLRMTQPTTTSFTLFVSTGLYDPSVSNVDLAAEQARKQCETWGTSLLSESKGRVLYVSCGGTTLVKGYDGKAGMQLKAEAAVTWPLTKNSPRTLTNTFQVSTNLYDPSVSNVEAARTQAWDRCQQWVTDTQSNSSATMVLATCEGPKVVKSGKVAVQYDGTVLLLVP